MKRQCFSHSAGPSFDGHNVFLWEAIPWEYLPPSAKVDLGLWIFGYKDALRIIPINGGLKNTKHTVKRLFPHAETIVHKDSLYMGNNKQHCHLVKSLDWLPSTHGEKLGILLGYPSCCSKYIAQFPETLIDSIAAWQNADLTGIKPHLLDISEYPHGVCLLSHIPCSLHCQASLTISFNFLKNIAATHGGKNFQCWKSSLLEKYGSLLN